MRHKLGTILIITVLTLLSSGAAWSQRTTANIYGTVADTTGAVIPGATVRLINELTGTEIEVTTNEVGEFSATFIPVGVYTLVVEADGFRTMRQTGLELVAGQQIRYPITLEVGPVAEQIEVTAEPPLLQTASTELSGRLESVQIENLPATRRDFTQLLELQPGVVRTSVELLTINGLASAGMTVTVDGVDSAGDTETPSLSMFQGRNFINVISREAIQEVNVTKGVMSAEVGRAFSGNVNVITKSGTNEFHGSLFHLWQNDVLNARYALAADKPPVRFNQFGGSLGGPIVKNKIFFFATYEGYRQSNFTIVNDDVPTPEFRAMAIAAVPEYEPGFRVFPDPTEPYDPGDAVGEWRGPAYDKATDDHVVARGDINFSAADRLSLRYTGGHPFRIIPRALITNQREYAYTTNVANVTWSHGAPTWTSETRLGINYNTAERLDQVYSRGLPGFEIKGGFGFDGELQQLFGSIYTFEEIVAKHVGRHTIKFGGMIHRAAPGRFNEETPRFRYKKPKDMLANKPQRVQFTFGVPRFRGVSWNFAGFIQDDFKLRPNLTLNLGLRYEYYTVFEDDQGRLVNPGSPQNAFANPVILRPPDSIYNADRNNFLPRVGLVWAPNQKTVVRAGAGIAVGPHNLRNFYTLVRYSPKVGFRYRFSGADLELFDTRYPITNEEGRQIVENLDIPTRYDVFDQDNPNPTSYKWTLDIQRELTPTMVFQAGYVGTRGVKVSLKHNINQPDRITGIRPVAHLLESPWRNASESSTYHGLQTSFRKRFSGGLTFNVNYTFSKTLAVTNGDYWGGNDPEVQDETNWAADWGPISSDRKHNFSMDWVWDAPFDRWTGATGALAHVVGGWQFTGLLRAASGAALTVEQDSNFDSSRPDYVWGEDPYLKGGDKRMYLNPAAFAEIPEGAGGAPIRPGNVGKGALRGPGFWIVDFSFAKRFNFTERVALRVGLDMFNALNHLNLRNPEPDITDKRFGLVRKVFPARSMQLTARLTF